MIRLPTEKISRAMVTRMHADHLNREHSATFRRYNVNKAADRELLAAVQGAPVRGKTETAKGARQPVRGGVISGMKMIG